MKILFDARYIRTDYHDGISRYSTELANAFAKISPVTFIIFDLEQLKFLPENCDYVVIHKPTSIKEVLSARILNKYNPDVVFSPMQTIGSISRKFKLIYTLHDMIYYRHRTPPANLNALIRLGWVIYHSTYAFQRRKLNSGDAVVTVSETSKSDIKNSKLTKKPIEVVYNAPKNLALELDNEIFQSDSGPRNVVYAGSFMGYKNVETIIKSMEYLPDHKLILMGPVSEKRKQQLEKIIPNGADVKFFGGYTVKPYAKILSDNAVLVTASLDEGFGLPVAEAMAFGIPVVISDIPVFHEVAGNGASYADPDSPRDFAEKIKKLDDKKFKLQQIENGLKHVEKFSWGKSAEVLFELIKKISVDK